MSLAGDFESFCANIRLNNLDDMESTAGEIARKLNKSYYELDGDTETHMYIVGSVGRQTAIAGSSDLDLLFDMPDDIYEKYDNYDSNGQSALLQDVKKALQDRYPRTDIRGDGQVVVVDFDKYTVELVPGFKQSDDRFKYPDTHNEGSWKYTDPLREQSECNNCNGWSKGIYFDFCHTLRSWKNTIGFEMGGLLIDTLVYNFFEENDWFSKSNTSDYLQILTDLYKYLKNEDPEQSYWLAVGSNQQVKNKDKGAFVSKAKKAFNKLNGKSENSEGINDTLRELLGNDFPQADKKTNESAQADSLQKSFSRFDRGASTEQFIEELVSVDIRYNLQIDCKVTQDGFRPFFLRNSLRNGEYPLRHNKSLDFFISSTDCPKPYEIWWKVRNVGPEAEKRNMIRGQILKTDKKERHEHTDFAGDHYVECYLVKNDVCVAKARINVPIGSI